MNGRRCDIHDLSAAADGLCALCHSHRARVAYRASNRRWRPIARVVVAVAAGLMVFAWLLAVYDTKKPRAKTDEVAAQP